MTPDVASRVSYHVAMDTTVTIEVVAEPSPRVEECIRRAFRWFDEVEKVCSRFDPASELSRLSVHTGAPVVVSELLFTLLQFAVRVAAASDGAFDPTVGAAMTEAGFQRNFRTGRSLSKRHVDAASFRDIVLTPATKSVALLRPLELDLGAIAKGFAVDLAARELRDLGSFAINAGGDIYVSGTSADGGPWRIGVRDPRDFDSLTATLLLSNQSVCTSGDYERRNTAGGHHILDPRLNSSSTSVASVTVVAPTAMVADALSTAAFVLGPIRGIEFLEDNGVEGLIISDSGEHYETSNLARYME